MCASASGVVVPGSPDSRESDSLGVGELAGRVLGGVDDSSRMTENLETRPLLACPQSRLSG
jgi:hypothetical protein